MKKLRKEQILNDIFDIPIEVIGDTPKLTIVSFDEMLIENYKGILEYEEFYIRIKTTIGIVNINGFGMAVEQITQEDIKIKGKIEHIDIERTTEDK